MAGLPARSAVLKQLNSPAVAVAVAVSWRDLSRVTGVNSELVSARKPGAAPGSAGGCPAGGVPPSASVSRGCGPSSGTCLTARRPTQDAQITRWLCRERRETNLTDHDGSQAA
jgi:hypothetical protein